MPEFGNKAYDSLDNVLVAVAYYIGHEKEFTGGLPFTFLVLVTAASMLGSEIIAILKKRKQVPAEARFRQGQQMVISNLIPFTKLNLIFAFGALITCIIRIFQSTQIGVPNLSIQIVVMLVCLLYSNTEARVYFKRKADLEDNSQTIAKRDRDTSIQDLFTNITY